jgi:dynein heavy chain
MYSPLPVIHFSPLQISQDGPVDLYQCPLYKTAVRAGTLSTTGQSTNFILHISLPVGVGQSVETWILRGVAALCAPPE